MVRWADLPLLSSDRGGAVESAGNWMIETASIAEGTSATAGAVLTAIGEAMTSPVKRNRLAGFTEDSLRPFAFFWRSDRRSDGVFAAPCGDAWEMEGRTDTHRRSDGAAGGGHARHRRGGQDRQ